MLDNITKSETKNTYKIGLKLRTIEINNIDCALRLFEQKVFDYIEIYVIPDTVKQYLNYWKCMSIPFCIHAPHSFHGVNLARKDFKSYNLKCYEEVLFFADEIKCEKIVAHGGNNGTIDETIKQLQNINDKRILIENKPYDGINGEICVGCTPDEIQKVLERAPVGGNILDFGHAVCAANSLGKDAIEMIEKMILFNPKMYHLADGDLNSKIDRHDNLGKGNFPIGSFLQMIEQDTMITLETPRNPDNGLDDFENDVQNLFKQSEI